MRGRGDYIVKAIVARSHLALVARTTHLVDEARKRHGASPTAIAAFGRLLSLTGIMGSLLREKQRISLQIISRGPIREMFSQSDWEGNVRGYIRWPYVDLPPKESGHLDVESALGHGGMLYVVKDLGMGEPYWGAISLKTGGVATDLAYYFTLSEGVPSAVGAGVYVGKYGEVLGAGGFIIQPLPNPDPKIMEKLEKNVSELKNISILTAQGEGPEDILNRLAKGLPITNLGIRRVRYRCSCSRQRAIRTLRLLGAKELIKMIDEDRRAEVVCQFCGSRYDFSEGELKEILQELTEGLPPS